MFKSIVEGGLLADLKKISGMGYIIFDNHMHLRTDGRFLNAVDMFLKAGGNSFNLVNLPDARLPLDDYYSRLYSYTVRMSEIITEERRISVPVTLGPYPLDYFRFKENGYDPVVEMKKGIDLAAKLIEQGKANALGEIGRPHFPTEPEIVDHCNEITEYAMFIASDLGSPLILHTEDLNPEGYRFLEKMADHASLQQSMLVKHHAIPEDFAIQTGLIRSVLASRPNVRKIMNSGLRLLLETDYVDDPSLGWKVIPPDSVPKRVELILAEVTEWEKLLENIFLKEPIRLFGEDIFKRTTEP